MVRLAWAPQPKLLVVRVDEVGRAEAVAYEAMEAQADPLDPTTGLVVDHYSRRRGTVRESRSGVLRGRCKTMRRTETTTWAPNCEQAVAQPRHLGAGARGNRGAQSQFLHQDVGGGGHQDPQLVGPEAAAAGAVDLQTV